MKLATRFLLKDLEIKISAALTSVINLENVFDFLNNANLYNMDGLRSICHEFIADQPESLQNYNVTKLTQVTIFQKSKILVLEIFVF